MNKVYLLIGGNMGDRLANLQATSAAIEILCGAIVRKSSIYETEAWGFKDQPTFLNQALLIETPKNAVDLLTVLLSIELSLGRTRSIHLGPRTVDIDIIYFNDAIINDNHLVIPHASMAERNFVLTPLTEIAPLFLHPILKKTNSQLLMDCSDLATVYKKNDL